MGVFQQGVAAVFERPDELTGGNAEHAHCAVLRMPLGVLHHVGRAGQHVCCSASCWMFNAVLSEVD